MARQRKTAVKTQANDPSEVTKPVKSSSSSIGAWVNVLGLVIVVGIRLLKRHWSPPAEYDTETVHKILWGIEVTCEAAVSLLSNFYLPTGSGHYMWASLLFMAGIDEYYDCQGTDTTKCRQSIVKLVIHGLLGPIIFNRRAN